MRYLLIIAVVLFAYTANAQTFNPVMKTDDVNLTTNVIKPLAGEETGLNALNLVIKGQVRTTFAEATTATITITCEPNRDVNITLHPPVDAAEPSYVALEGNWTNGHTFSPIESPLTIASDELGEISLIYTVTKIDATHPDVTTGLKTFVVTADFAYTGM